MSASLGAVGGLRRLVYVRSVLGNLGCPMVPEEVAVPGAGKAFAADGDMVDAAVRARAEVVGVGVADLVSKLQR